MLLKIVFFSSQYFFYRLSSFFCLSQFFSFSHKSFSISRVISQRFFFSVQLTSQRKTQELSQKIYMNNFFLLFCFEEFFTLPLSISSEYKFAREKKTTTLNNQKPRFTSGERAEKRKKINFCIRVIDKLLQWSKKLFGNYFLISFGIRKIFCYFQHNFNHNQMKFLLLFFSSTIYSFFNFLSFYSYSEHTQKKIIRFFLFWFKIQKKNRSRADEKSFEDRLNDLTFAKLLNSNARNSLNYKAFSRERRWWKFKESEKSSAQHWEWLNKFKETGVLSYGEFQWIKVEIDGILCNFYRIWF